MIVTEPDHGFLNAFDACSVEAATKTNKDSPVYVYIWTSEISPSDYWAKVVSRIKGAQLSYLDINKVSEIKLLVKAYHRVLHIQRQSCNAPSLRRLGKDMIFYCR